MSKNGTRLPLEGVLVVAVEQAVAGPAATCKLADAGARVIKIERPGGDVARTYDEAANGISSYFAWANRGKESLVLDYKTEEGAALLHRLLRKADVFLQNIAPGALEKVGFDSGTLRATYPQLVTCDISGYGLGHAASALKAYDLLVQCESGLVSVSGVPEMPGRIGVSICDMGAGTNAALAIMMALAQRDKTGAGSGVEVSLFDTAADWMTVPILFERYAGGSPGPMGLAHPTIAPYGAFRTSDHHQVVLSIHNNREWKKFCDVFLESPDLATDARFDTNLHRVKHRPALDALIQARFGTMTLEEARQRLSMAQCAYGQVRQVSEMLEHPALRTWDMAGPRGNIAMVAPPYKAEWDAGTFHGAPSLGAHTESITQEFRSQS
jgi:crotonobetainyl-CoA:carnitine CoA-transferase CaiB-like acyl-CoA transferase